MIVRINGREAWVIVTEKVAEIKTDVQPQKGPSKPLNLKTAVERIKVAVKDQKLIAWRPDDYVTYELTPTSSVKNTQAYVLAKVVASFYRQTEELRTWDFSRKTALFTLGKQYRINFRVVFTKDTIRFYLLVPRARAAEIMRKAESVYHENITVQEVTEPLPQIDVTRAYGSELTYRKHDIFSLDTDRGNSYPLPSLLTAVRTLEGDDLAVFDTMLEPTDRKAWEQAAAKAHKQLENGQIPRHGLKLLQKVDEVFNALRWQLLELAAFTPQHKRQLKQRKKEENRYQEVKRIMDNMTTSTKRKAADDVLNTWVRIAAHSDSPERAKSAVKTLANAWKDLSADNQVDVVAITPKWTAFFIESINKRRAFSIRMRPLKLSTEEAGKFMQLPGDYLINEFPQIQSRKFKDVSVPKELTQDDVKGIRVGVVTERGTRQLVKMPLEAYEGVKLKEVYDAVCTGTFGQGKQGTGKTEGFGTVTAYDMIVNGFSVLAIATDDGEGLRNLINSLPEDYPDDKIHALNFDNKAWPIACNWSDIYGRTFAQGDAELQALEISERITDRFIQFVNSLSNTGDFTDRMAQYVVSCMRAITKVADWSFLDLELALTSPAYRAELLQLEAVKEMPEVAHDLQTLQGRAEAGKDGEIVNPILSRVKALAGTQFMANLFYQDPKRNDDGSPTLDLRRIMDNPEGSYGHVVAIYASGDAWNDNQATILGFMLDKINFNAFSRVDVSQDQRRPALVWIDEPHKVIKSMEDKLAGTAVEFRKYRIKNLFTGHSIDQMGKAANSLLDGGAQVISYKTERLSEFTRFAHKFAPYDDAAALYEALPEKWRAICSLRLPSGKTCPAFLADMTPPPGKIKDRAEAWQRCAEKYGRPWKEVRDAIQGKRAKYQALNYEWTADRKAEALAAKAEEKGLLKQAKAK